MIVRTDMGKRTNRQNYSGEVQEVQPTDETFEEILNIPHTLIAGSQDRVNAYS